MVVLGPQAEEGENVFGVAHIFASFNDTFIHVTDLSGTDDAARCFCIYQTCCRAEISEGGVQIFRT